MTKPLQVASQPVITRAADASDLPEISNLHARIFGPGRFARTAYRIREGQEPISPFCRVATSGGTLVAALRFTKIAIGGTPGALLLGPLAVDTAFVNQGVGRQLISEGLELARAHGIGIVVLVGDEPYYGRFGFRPVPPGEITLPGPVNPARILALELRAGATSEFRGAIGTG